MTFGQRLRGERAKVKMSQSELTRLSGVPKTMVSRYENDHILPSISTLEKLARALRIGTSVLLSDGDDDVTFTEALRARGFELQSSEQAARLAHVIADLAAEGDSRVSFLRLATESA
jgi:transcriptional regulator with XRE-family HTH domain